MLVVKDVFLHNTLTTPQQKLLSFFTWYQSTRVQCNPLQSTLVVPQVKNAANKPVVATIGKLRNNPTTRLTDARAKSLCILGVQDAPVFARTWILELYRWHQ